MRTTIIPAQITTVEDKIAGSFSMTQILILMFPVLLTAIIYILFFPTMKLVLYKLILILITTLICVVLAIRVKDKIVAQWLGVLVKYQNRPKYYLFNKNDLTNRTVDLPNIPAVLTNKKLATKVNVNKTTELKLSDLIKLEHLIDTGKVALHYQFDKKSL